MILLQHLLPCSQPPRLKATSSGASPSFTMPPHILLLLVALLLLGHPGGAWGHQVRAACPPEAAVCEFYLEMTEATTMTLPLEDGRRLRVEVDEGGQFYRMVSGSRVLLNQTEVSRMALGDGSHKKVLLYNGTLPGPPIVVYEGQQVMMRLWNRMKGLGTTVHFHGAKQHNTPWMDGVAGVSQCDVLPGERFTYRFLAFPVGTHWYHSHHGTQRSMGAAGPFIVLEQNDATSQQRRGTSQLPAFDDDFYMLIQDWFREKSEEIVYKTSFDAVKYPGFNRGICYNSTKQYNYVDSGVLPFETALINGRGRYMGQDPRYPKPTFIPYESFQVRVNGYYRFRVIGASLQFPLEVSIDQHPLNVIASDGNHLKAKATDSIIVHNGERYDFYIKADDPLSVGNYWIRVQTLERVQDNHPIEPGSGKAILRYEGAALTDPSTSLKACSPPDPCHVSNCPYPSEVTERHNIVCHPITDFSQPLPEPTLQPEEGEEIHEIFLNFHFAVSDTNQPEPITTADNITWQPRSGTEKPTINGVQNVLSVSSPMTYPPDNGEDTVEHCHFASCPTGLCRMCEHHLHLPLNTIIQLNFMVTLNNAPGVINGNDHPIHIHGHALQVLKVAYPSYHPVTKAYYKGNTDIACPKDNCNTVVWSNSSWTGGNVPGILHQGAPRKDSLVIPVGGYVVTRFRTDNPGFWFMHCHLEFHNAEGMSLVLKVGNESQMNAKPRGMRTCSNFRWPEAGDFDPCNGSDVDGGMDEDQVQEGIVWFKASAIGLYIVAVLVVPIACTLWRLYCSAPLTPSSTQDTESNDSLRDEWEHLGMRYKQVKEGPSKAGLLSHKTI